MALTLAGPAFAQCTPDPTQTNGTTTCSGIDTDGLAVTTYGTIVSVPAAATVLGADAPAIDIRLPCEIYGSPLRVSIGGRVDGGTGSGVRLLSQPATNGYGQVTAQLAMTVAEGGSVSGACRTG